MIIYYLFTKINILLKKHINIYEYFDLTWLFEYAVEKIKINNIYKFFTYKNIFSLSKKKNLVKYKHAIFIKNIYCVYLVCIILNVFFFINTQYFNFFKNFSFYLILIFVVYFFITTYFHFSKTYQINKYTSQIQRFWKRTFGAVWVLEFFLFAIYMFLTLISPAELPMYAINYKEIITGIEIIKNSNYHMLYLTLICIVNLCFTFMIFLKKKNNFIHINIMYVVIIAIYSYILYFEFLKFYYVAGWGNHSVYLSNKSTYINGEFNNLYAANNLKNQNEVLYFKTPTSTTNTWNDTFNEKQWVRTFRHFLYILLILKFWHVFFIFFYVCLSIQKFVETQYISFDTISSNHQNSIYIMWFYLFSYLLIIKKKFYFIIIMMYYITFSHINFVNTIQSFINESYITYIFYV